MVFGWFITGFIISEIIFIIRCMLEDMRDVKKDWAGIKISSFAIGSVCTVIFYILLTNDDQGMFGGPIVWSRLVYIIGVSLLVALIFFINKYLALGIATVRSWDKAEKKATRKKHE